MHRTFLLAVDDDDDDDDPTQSEVGLFNKDQKTGTLK